MFAVILITDSLNRFKAGETGKILPCDFDKYDYKVDLGTSELITEGFLKGVTQRRIFYFFKNEIEVLG